MGYSFFEPSRNQTTALSRTQWKNAAGAKDVVRHVVGGKVGLAKYRTDHSRARAGTKRKERPHSVLGAYHPDFERRSL
jgi:hypothetical protein